MVLVYFKNNDRLRRYRQKLHVASQISRFTGITVGTEFDPKELMFRNYLGLINQDSKPAARVTFSAGEQKEVFTIGWLDPSGRLVAKNKLQVTIPSSILIYVFRTGTYFTYFPHHPAKFSKTPITSICPL